MLLIIDHSLLLVRLESSSTDDALLNALARLSEALVGRPA
jgi:hypothetical protein